jgi:hypothetical protein
VIGLRWEWINLDNQTASVPSSDFKARRRHTIPLYPTAVAILKKYMVQHDTFVFTKKGARLKDFSRWHWAKVRRALGLPRLRPHDLRHTFASHHVQGGTPLNVLQVLGGWKSPERCSGTPTSTWGVATSLRQQLSGVDLSPYVGRTVHRFESSERRKPFLNQSLGSAKPAVRLTPNNLRYESDRNCPSPFARVQSGHHRTTDEQDVAVDR